MAETLEASIVDTSAPFQSVREVTTRFGGFGHWNPQDSHNFELGCKASELEKELIAKEGETLKLLKSLESTKAIVKELRSKLQRQEDKENRDTNVLNASEMSLVAARKMKEAAKAIEAVAIAETKAVTSRRRRRNGEETLQEEILETIKETAKEIRRSRRRLEEGLAKVTTAKTEAEETLWQWSEQRRRRRRSSYKAKYKNSSLYQDRGETFLMDVNGLSLMMNGDGTSSSVAVLKPTLSMREIVGRKVVLGDESRGMMNGRVTLGQILGKSNNGGVWNGERNEKEHKFSGKRKRFGFGYLSLILNKESKKIALNLK